MTETERKIADHLLGFIEKYSNDVSMARRHIDAYNKFLDSILRRRQCENVTFGVDVGDGSGKTFVVLSGGQDNMATGPLDATAGLNDGSKRISVDELRVICDTVVALTAIRQKGCNHLAVENFAPPLMHHMLSRLRYFKLGNMRIVPAQCDPSQLRG